MATEGDAAVRAAIGSAVRNRLASNPAALKIPSNDLDIFVVREFLTAQECAGLIALIDVDRVPSQLLAPTQEPDYRTSESCNLDPRLPLVGQVEAKISHLLGIDPAHGETVQGQRYAVGQQFKPHHDFFHPGEPYWDEMMRTGGQRTWTAMVFLNAPEGGGETRFPEAGIKVTPRPGNLLTWNNLTAWGEPNRFSIHEGCPVAAGVKYIVTKWYRERPWSPSDIPTY